MWFRDFGHTPERIVNWLTGWREILEHDCVPGYRERARHQRLLLELRVLGHAFRTRGFWRLFVWYHVLCLAAMTGCWCWDLSGLRAALLQFMPGVVIFPWIANGRKRLMRHLLQ